MKKLLFALLTCTSSALAWTPAVPEVRLYFSRGGEYVARVEPSISKLDEDPKGPARLLLFHYDSAASTYSRVSSVALENKYAPGKILLTPDGARIIAVDDFYDWQYKSPVIVIYDSAGVVLKKLMLDEIIAKVEASELRKSSKPWMLDVTLGSGYIYIQRDGQVAGPGDYKKSLKVSLTDYRITDDVL